MSNPNTWTENLDPTKEGNLYTYSSDREVGAIMLWGIRNNGSVYWIGSSMNRDIFLGLGHRAANSRADLGCYFHLRHQQIVWLDRNGEATLKLMEE